MSELRSPKTTNDSKVVSGINRRNLIKASAGAGAMLAVASGAAPVGIQPATTLAQEASGTRARNWEESDNIDTSIKLEGDGWVTLETEFPFWALGFGWDREVGTWPVVQYGISYDGVTWDDGYAMDAHSDGGPVATDNRHHTDLHFADGQQYIRYRTVDGEGNLVVLDRFQVTYIDPTDGPWSEDRKVTLMRTTAVNDDTAVPPAIITRAQWGANESYRRDSTGEIWPPEYAEVKHAIVHHAAVNYGSDGYNAIRSIYYYHAITQGWGDIGYNYLIDTQGHIFEGRVGGANVIGGHAFQYAIGSSGICVMGDYTSADAPQAAKVALANIIAYVTRDLNPHGTAPFHEVPAMPTIAGHRDVVQSGCPGNGLYDDLPWIRNTVATTLDRGLLDSQAPGGIVPGDWVKIQVETGSGLQMRTAPGTDQPIVATIPNGTRVEVEEGARAYQGYNWYLVMYGGRKGWVVADWLVVDPPTDDPMQGYLYGQNIRLRGTVTLRTSPSVNAASAGAETGTWAFLMAGPYTAGGTKWFQIRTQNGREGWITIDQFAIDKTTAPASAYKMGAAVRTVRSTAIRVRPGIPQTTQGTVGAGTRLTISVAPVGTTGGTWYGVYGGTGIGGGWVNATDIDIAPTPVTAVGQRFRVTENMNLRGGPGTGFATVGTLTAGTTGTVIGGPTSANGYKWWDVRTDNGQQGWAADNWLLASGGTAPTNPTDPPPSSGGKFAAGDTVRVTEGLNMRSGPSTSNGVVAVLDAGTTGKVIGGPGSANGYTWWRIETSRGTGWVVENWIVKQGGSTPTDPPPTTGGKFAIGDTARVTENLNMRSGPGTANGVITILGAGVTGKVIEGPRSGSGYTWWRLETNQGTGWVVQDWVVKQSGGSTPPPSSGGKFAIGDTARVTEGVNMRTGAGTGNGVITVLQPGTTGKVIEGPRSANGYTWWRLQTSAGTGWVVQDWITKSAPATPKFAKGDTVRVTEPLNIRSGAGTGSGSIAVLQPGVTGKVIDGPQSASGYVWWRIETGQGTGWAAQDWLTK